MLLDGESTPKYARERAGRSPQQPGVLASTSAVQAPLSPHLQMLGVKRYQCSEHRWSRRLQSAPILRLTTAHMDSHLKFASLGSTLFGIPSHRTRLIREPSQAMSTCGLTRAVNQVSIVNNTCHVRRDRTPGLCTGILRCVANRLFCQFWVVARRIIHTADVQRNICTGHVQICSSPC
jgi:hypothetical protein